jgi:hypothetical protein
MPSRRHVRKRAAVAGRPAAARRGTAPTMVPAAKLDARSTAATVSSRQDACTRWGGRVLGLEQRSQAYGVQPAHHATGRVMQDASMGGASSEAGRRERTVASSSAMGRTRSEARAVASGAARARARRRDAPVGSKRSSRRVQPPAATYTSAPAASLPPASLQPPAPLAPLAPPTPPVLSPPQEPSATCMPTRVYAGCQLLRLESVTASTLPPSSLDSRPSPAAAASAAPPRRDAIGSSPPPPTAFNARCISSSCVPSPPQPQPQPPQS